ncbi:hypothetical protein FisN_33Lh027 [Fistulifera solaris]|uniref:DUF6824 domain-containing protein n=1 Tax=Fistulifera solaris TaxID=1519565 RepID=A0A1Z5KAB4_FISSO|nr:hypothetical protein FisN_33Lh027 [Fistulifera solaris]|eukprot:GAX23136.1 hypothetical protein FisN_33Lh027 [Fistulifera solaris]
MTLSGLDSIALAVAHLERVEASLGPSDTAQIIRPSVFLNHARVVSTEDLDQVDAPHISVPLPWNYSATGAPSPPVLPTFTLTNNSNGSVLNHNNQNHSTVVSMQTSVAARPDSSFSTTSSSSFKKLKKGKTSITPPRNKQYKNLMLLFDMAPYPIPKDAHSDAIVSNTDIQEDDVLLGRGGETNHHTGNIQYRLLVKACQPAYLAAKRRDKPRIAAGIVLAVRRAGGRFLKKEEDDDAGWKDVGNVRAREKTSQALREGAPDLRPQLSL